MEEKNIVKFKKEEYGMREYIKSMLGKGKVSRVRIEYTPVGEKIVVSTSKPGLIIGRKGEKISELTGVLKTRFKLENPHIEIDEIRTPDLDPQIVADDIALGLEKMGPLKFKVLAYKALQRIMAAGAQGAEIRLGGKLPSSRAKVWRFAQGYLKKTGDTAKLVARASAISQTRPGIVGIKVSILAPDTIMKDRVKVDDELIGKIRMNAVSVGVSSNESKTKKSVKKESKKSSKKNEEDVE